MRFFVMVWLALAPAATLAHPHIFIDAGLEVVVDETGRLTHVRVTWAYDEYYSLLITEHLKLDADYDGQLTDEEQAILTGFDMNWVQGYEGDLVARLDGQPLKLSGPMEPTAEFANGRITTTHLRAVVGQPDLTGAALTLAAFDPTYYTAYEVTLPVRLTGGGTCMIQNLSPTLTRRWSKNARCCSVLMPTPIWRNSTSRRWARNLPTRYTYRAPDPERFRRSGSGRAALVLAGRRL